MGCGESDVSIMPMNVSSSQDDNSEEPASVTSLSAEQFVNFLGIIPYAAIIVDEVGRIVRVNSLAEGLFGYTEDEFTGRSIDTLLPERYRARHARHQAQYMANPKPRPMETRLDLVGLDCNGRELPIEVALNPLLLEEERCILVVVRDISRRVQEEDELRRSQEQMRALSERLLTLREEERARISRSMHDEIGQMLSGLNMDVAWLQRRLGPGQEALQDKTEAMSRLIDTAVQAVRQVATELRPGILDDLGLEAAVEWQLQEFQRRTDIRCTLSSDIKESALDVARTTAAFRILQESLTNVVRHAQASQVEVVLTSNETELMLLVRDDGRGITDSERDHPRSIGLLGMCERARMQGGTLEIKGVAGRGSTVVLRLPLTAGEEE
jgi:PAS domain S-box-containing protein